MITTLIILFTLSFIVSVVQSYIIRLQRRLLDTMIFTLKEQEERNEMLLLFSIQTILTDAIEEEDYETAEKCRKILGKLTRKENGSI